jgi:RnfABCDGE-type electron transport complex B subunit
VGTALVATLIMTGLGVFFGVGLAVAHRFLRVEEDPRLELLVDMLPNSNCGACGEAGCRAFAEQVLVGAHAPRGCTVASETAIESIAAFLGVDPGQAEKRVARLHCAGGIGAARQIAEYKGYASCRAAHLVGGGGKGCSWGCLGLVPVVDVDRCTACNDCVEVCPRDLFELMPVSHALIVQCKAPLEGDEARAICSVACDACGRCAQDAAPGLIRMENNLPVVDYGAGGPAMPQATHRCPTNAIVWLDRAQFAPDERSPRLLEDAPR